MSAGKSSVSDYAPGRAREQRFAIFASEHEWLLQA
jgi:hypothetical protein